MGSENANVVEIKCPFLGRDLDPKAAFLAYNVGGIYNADGKMELKTSHPYYFQVQTQMAVSGLQKCDFVTYTNKSIHIVEIDFNKKFWDDVITKVTIFYKSQIIPALLLQFSSQLLQASSIENEQNNVSGDSKDQTFVTSTSFIKDDNSGDDSNDCRDDQVNKVQEVEMDDSNVSGDSESFTSVIEDDNSDDDQDDSVYEVQDFEMGDSNVKSKSDKINSSKLIEFLKRLESRKTLENFILNGCGETKQFSLKNVTFKTITTLKKLINDDKAQNDILDEILQELFVLFPGLNQGLLPIDISRAISVTQKLIEMYQIEQSSQ